MDKFLKDSLGWGVVLWFIGYILGYIFYFIVPPSFIGWYIMPIGTIITIFVIYKFIKSTAWYYYLIIAMVWTILAIVMDYFLIVKLLNPTEGYYKLDVYVYYSLTLVLPIVVGGYKIIRAGKLK